MQKNELLASIKYGIMQRNPEAEVILFGSRVKGDYHSNSDWDILVLTKEKVTYELERDFRQPIFDLELDTGTVISLMVYSKHDWQRLKEVRFGSISSQKLESFISSPGFIYDGFSLYCRTTATLSTGYSLAFSQ